MSDTSGLYYRFQLQKCDPNNLYNKDRASYERHTQEITRQQTALRRLINEAEKAGCIVPPEAYYWVNLPPPTKPCI